MAFEKLLLDPFTETIQAAIGFVIRNLR